MKSAGVAAWRFVSVLMQLAHAGDRRGRGIAFVPARSAVAPPRRGGELPRRVPDRVSASVFPFVASVMADTVVDRTLVSPKTFLTRKSAAHLARSTALPTAADLRNNGSMKEREIAIGRPGAQMS